MNKRMIACLCCLIPLVFAGCWDYRGIDKLTILTGIAIDFDKAAQQYLLTVETVDTSVSIKEQGPQSKIIQTEGKTIFDALRNAKKRTKHRLYGHNTQIVVLSSDIVENEDIQSILGLFLSDEELRETIYITVSEEPTASDIFLPDGGQQGLIAFQLDDIIRYDNKVTASTNSVMLYEAYNTLKAEGKSLTLPLIRQVKNADEPVNEVNGVAVFKGQRMVGTLSSEESKYLLFILDKVEGGLLTIPVSYELPDEVTLEISQNKTNLSYAFENGEIVVRIKTDTEVYLGESMVRIDMTDKYQIRGLEEKAEEKIEQKIKNLIGKVQTEYNSDIFGFGNEIYKRDYGKWQQIKDEWNELFPRIRVEVESTVTILNTALIKQEGKEE